MREARGPATRPPTGSSSVRKVYQSSLYRRLPLLGVVVGLVLLGIAGLVIPLLGALQAENGVNVLLFILMPIGLVLFPIAWWLYRRVERMRLQYLFVSMAGVELHDGDSINTTSWDNIERIGYVRSGILGQRAVALILINPPQSRGRQRAEVRPPYTIVLHPFIPPFTTLDHSLLGRDIRQYAPRLFQQRWTPVG